MDIDDARPAEHFALGPYRAENFYQGVSGVMNRNGINCLTFKSKPGAVLTDYETALAIADRWNKWEFRR